MLSEFYLSDTATGCLNRLSSRKHNRLFKIPFFWAGSVRGDIEFQPVFQDDANALAELGEDERESRDLAASFKESRRLWFRDLLSKLDVDDPDTLATQLSLLIDGAYSAMLTRKDPSSTRAAIAAARVLLKNAGVNLSYTQPLGTADQIANQDLPPRSKRQRTA